MTVIAFRPRAARGGSQSPAYPALSGTFRSPTGGSGQMTGSVRVQRLVLAPRGAFVSGFFTGELRDEDGSLVGTDSRRATVPVDLVRESDGFRPWVRAVTLDLMGIGVDVAPFPIDPTLAFPGLDPVSRRPRGRALEPARPVS